MAKQFVEVIEPGYARGDSKKGDRVQIEQSEVQALVDAGKVKALELVEAGSDDVETLRAENAELKAQLGQGNKEDTANKAKR